MKIGYARVSTREQTLETKLSRLADADCEMFFEEKISGAKGRHPRLEDMLDQLRKDDVVVVTKMGRCFFFFTRNPVSVSALALPAHMRRHGRFTPGLTTDDARLTEKRGWLLFSFRGRKEEEVLIQDFPTLLGQPLRPSRQRSAVAAYFRDHGDDSGDA